MAKIHLKLDEIIDGTALRRDLAALTVARNGDGADAEIRASVLKLLKARLAEGRAAAEAMLRQDGGGIACAERLSHLNVGSGSEVSIAELAHLVADVVGYTGRIVQDPSKPDGTPRKLMDSSALAALGWRPTIALSTGLAETYAWYLANVEHLRQA